LGAGERSHSQLLAHPSPHLGSFDGQFHLQATAANKHLITRKHNIPKQALKQTSRGCKVASLLSLILIYGTFPTDL
jgi:hypothetical protein